MPQLFPKKANAIAKSGLIVLLSLPAGVVAAAYALNSSSYVTKQGLAREQVVPFSHKHHVNALGLDCRYCHTSVEESAFANIPPTQTCMTCHSQIWTDSPMLEPVRASYRENKSLEWLRVHDLPDFVYFNHSIHVSKGMGCTTCHGPVDQMPLMQQHGTLTMGWCLDCHRNPEKNVRPQSEVFSVDWKPPANQAEKGAALVAEYEIQKLDHCNTCHR